MKYIQSYDPSLKFVVSIVNEYGAGYTPPFIELTSGTIYRVVSGGTEHDKLVLTLKSNGRQIGLMVHKRFRHPYKNELKKVVI